MDYRNPVKLTSPRVWRTYQGGSLIDAIHGIQGEDSQFPEEWLLSVVNARNPGREHISDEGLCRLVNGNIYLRDYIAADPEQALGAAHVRRFGNSLGILAKILDSGERLTIQVHPNRDRAMELFGSPFGKTESWHILNCRNLNGEEACIYLGFREGITKERWMEIFHQQDIPAMLSCLHRIPVKPGDTYLVEAGVPHAIGAGCLLLEIQEPTDYTVRTERISPKGLKISDAQCHQGLGFERMFECFEYRAIPYEQALASWKLSDAVLEEREGHTGIKLIGEEDTPCFSLKKYFITNTCEMKGCGRPWGFYIFSGIGKLMSQDGSNPIGAGDQFFVSAVCDGFRIEAEEPITAFCYFSPKADA